jgi:hypothetical protein
MDTMLFCPFCGINLMAGMRQQNLPLLILFEAFLTENCILIFCGNGNIFL